jgi:hypothetical protein
MRRRQSAAASFLAKANEDGRASFLDTDVGKNVELLPEVRLPDRR